MCLLMSDPKGKMELCWADISYTGINNITAWESVWPLELLFGVGKEKKKEGKNEGDGSDEAMQSSYNTVT